MGMGARAASPHVCDTDRVGLAPKQSRPMAGGGLATDFHLRLTWAERRALPATNLTPQTKPGNPVPGLWWAASHP